MQTKFLITITHKTPIADLADKIAARAYVLDGVENAEAAAVPDAIIRMAKSIAADKFEHCTSDPIFTVQKLRQITGLDTDYTENIGWFSDGHQITGEEAAELEKQYDETGDIPDDHCRTGIAEEWQHYVTYITPESAQALVDAKGDQLRTYVDSGCRNSEWKAMREFLLSIAKATS